MSEPDTTGVAVRLTTALADRYRIERELGAGGMATVYLAEDLRHARRVAIKVLRPELAAVIGAERFVREIRTVAALQHPHILGLIDSGEVNGTAYYVMPYVEGESLRDRLARERQLPVGEAVRLATEIAAALDYAHRHGVIHRDVKPENILLHDGAALVADFGIALAVSKTGSSRMTETGMSLGTPHYMSPEQAMGEREIDARSDVYALGCITYEMLTGEPPFTGSTVQSIMARVMTEAPRPITAQRRTVPPGVEAAVLTALEKLPADRFDSAAAFATALTAEPSSRGAERRRDRATGRLDRFGPSALAMAVGALLLAGVAGWQLALRTARPAAPMTLGAFTRVTWEPGLEILPAISPDGRSIAYAAGTMYSMQIYVRPVSGGRSIRLTDDSTGVQSHPSWSPDGSRVLFLQNNAVFSAPATGGPARPEVPPTTAGLLSGAAWSPDGDRIAWTAGDSLFIREADGANRALTAFPEPHRCSWSPTGDLIACGSGNVLAIVIGEVFGNISPSTVVVARVSDGTVEPVTDSLSVNESVVWSADGRSIFFVSDRHGPRDLYAQRMSKSGRPDGAPVRITAGLNVHTFSLSADGRRLAYSSLVNTANIWSVSLTDATEPAARLTSGNQTTESSTTSADGEWLYYDSDVSGNMDLYRLRLSSGGTERLTTEPADDFAPTPSPDGRELAFHSWRGGISRDIYVMPLDGGPVSRVTETPQLQEALAAWSPDGNALAFCEFSAAGGIWIARRVNGVWQAAERRLDRGFWPVWSPDGRSLAFTTAIVDGLLAVMPADSGPARLVTDSSAGVLADRSVWSPDGRSLLFRGRGETPGRNIYRVAVGDAPGISQRVALLAGVDQIAIRGGWGMGRDRAYFSMTERGSDVTVVDLER